jgi:FkbM family methyltransferase
MKNWPVYFRRKYFKTHEPALYIFRGDGIKLEVPDHFFYVFKEIVMEDFYDIKHVLRHVPSNGVIVDIGANAGYFSFLMTAKRKDAAIYAYEPLDINFRLLSRNLELNEEKRTTIRAEQKAVTGKEEGSVKLFFDAVGFDTVISSVYDDFSVKNTEATEVSAISLSEIIHKNKLPVIDLLKLDCEGSEYPILYDSPETIWPLIKCLCIEVHELDKGKRNHNSLSGFLEGKGYELRSRPDINGCHYLVAWK